MEKKFSDKKIKALKPKDYIYDLREPNGNGFAIRVFPSGEKSWVFIYTYQGRKRRMTLGKYPTMTLANAKIEHRKALGILETSKKDPALLQKAEKIEIRDSSTVEGLIEEYLEKWAKERKRSWKEDQRILYKDVRPSWGKIKAKDITKRDVILLLDKVKERGAPIIANRTFACIRRMFNFAVERDILTTTPCLSIKAPTKENRRDRCLSTEEIKDFWLSLDTTPMLESTKLALKFQLVTAQRKGEVVAAEWDEIDLITGWWTIPAEKAKNGNLHRIPLSKLAIDLLQEIKNLSGESQWLFPSTKNNLPMRGQSVDHALRRSISSFAALKQNITPHDLRRTAATHMTALGISRLVVSKILNHAESGVTSIYDVHSYDKEKLHALEAWGNKLKEMIYGLPVNNIVQLNKMA